MTDRLEELWEAYEQARAALAAAADAYNATLQWQHDPQIRGVLDAAYIAAADAYDTAVETEVDAWIALEAAEKEMTNE